MKNETAAEDLIVRPTKEEDLTALLAMERECFADPYGEDAVRQTLRSPVAKNFIALSGTRPTGYLFATEVCDEAEILRIAVRKGDRKRGIARALLASFFATLSGTTRCFLEVRKSNEEAIRLYAAAGFSLYGERKNYYRNPTEDALLLRRPEEKEP